MLGCHRWDSARSRMIPRQAGLPDCSRLQYDERRSTLSEIIISQNRHASGGTDAKWVTVRIVLVVHTRLATENYPVSTASSMKAVGGDDHDRQAHASVDLVAWDSIAFDCLFLHRLIVYIFRTWCTAGKA